MEMPINPEKINPFMDRKAFRFTDKERKEIEFTFGSGCVVGECKRCRDEYKMYGTNGGQLCPVCRRELGIVC
jgi:hypothetical protein